MSPLLIFIIVSAFILSFLVAARVFEERKGRNIWKSLGMGGLLAWLERSFETIADNISHFDAKNIAEYVKNTWHVLKIFYIALQRLATEKIAQDRFTPSENGNKAASFYLKSIKEHKEKVHDTYSPSTDMEDKVE